MNTSTAIFIIAAPTFALFSTDCDAYDSNGIALKRGPGNEFLVEIDRAAYDRMNCASVSDCPPWRTLLSEKIKLEKPCPAQYLLSPPNTEKSDRIRHFGLCFSLPATNEERRQPQQGSQLPGNAISIQPSGAYATIDTRLAFESIGRLGASAIADRSAAIDEVIGKASEQMPPVLYALANVLSRESGRIEEAIFWYHVGRLRAVYDAQRCRDETARQAVGVLGMGLSQELRKAHLENPERVLPIAKRAIEWDAANPHSYDHRWINLHGMGAIQPSNSVNQMTVSENEWPAILAKVHSEHLKNVEAFAAKGGGRP